jgi:hypothetical protein
MTVSQSRRSRSATMVRSRSGLARCREHGGISLHEFAHAHRRHAGQPLDIVTESIVAVVLMKLGRRAA